MKLKRIRYSSLNSRQQEDYNFQKVSGVLADYGFATLRLNADWKGADFIAQHVDGQLFLRVQLKGRLVVDTKYKGREIWICFPYAGKWYLYPHDDFLKWALAHTNIGETKGWSRISDWERIKGRYTWPRPSGELLDWLNQYAL